MSGVTRDHFRRAAADIGAHGDNDTLPFDVDNAFIKEQQDKLVDLADGFSCELGKGSAKSAKNAIDSASLFSERLLTPSGPSGFRIVTKIHPFWGIYYNGLAVAIAEVLEPTRSDRAHSYRYAPQGDDLFRRDASWRAFRLATIAEPHDGEAVIVQTDIASFYEHVSHHRLENRINDLFPQHPTVATQIDRLLSRLASGRSFGLPVGGQGSRILAEALLSLVDEQLDDAGLDWRRYVDDFVLISHSQADAYRALSKLSNALADYGLTLNRTKTTVLSGAHYRDYVRAQLGLTEEESAKLLEIDLHFDPYSDDPYADFEELKGVVESLDISKLLDLELSKAQPDTFLVSQITRTLRLHDPNVALQLCSTLLSSKTMHAFRASWSTLMRGVAAVRGNEKFKDISHELDALLDGIPAHSSHLLMAETSSLHYLRTLRFRKTPKRAEYVLQTYSQTRSQTVRRACIDCWRHWRDRASFTRERNQWNALPPEEQRMLWLSAKKFGDEGSKFRSQVRQSIANDWKLGIEHGQGPTFASIFVDWGEAHG
jgi:hypothetical protein